MAYSSTQKYKECVLLLTRVNPFIRQHDENQLSEVKFPRFSVEPTLSGAESGTGTPTAQPTSSRHGSACSSVRGDPISRQSQERRVRRRRLCRRHRDGSGSVTPPSVPCAQGPGAQGQGSVRCRTSSGGWGEAMLPPAPPRGQATSAHTGADGHRCKQGFDTTERCLPFHDA